MRRAITLLPGPKPPVGVRYEWIALGPGAGVHVFTPQSANGEALLWIHGGGMVIGSAAQDHARCSGIALELGCTVVSAEYRLAPEHPFPAPLDDCATAWHWLVRESPKREIDPGRIVIGGQSAGGGLAASLVQRIHDEHRVQPVGQWLFCPMLDDCTAARRDLDGAKHVLWNNRSNRAGWSAYLGVEPGATDVPEYAVPSRRIDFRGLPATWIGVGDIELFFEEDVAYAEALQHAAVNTTLVIVPGAPHGFETIAENTTLATDYVTGAMSWLEAHLQGVG